MERDRMTEARSALSRLQFTATKKKARIHEGAMDENSNRIRALHGICGECQHINPDVKHKDGRTRVSLRCRAGMSPLDLYTQTDLGETPDCIFFTPTKEKDS